MKKAQMILNTDAESFLNWLRNRDRQIHMRSFPTDSGHIDLQGAGIRVPQAGRIVVELESSYLGKSGTAKSLGTAIDFELLPLSADRLEVMARCMQDVTLPHFHQLLKDIEQRWPEAVPETRNEPKLGIGGEPIGRKMLDATKYVKEQVHQKGRPRNEVYLEWYEMRGREEVENLANPWDSFNQAVGKPPKR